MQLLAAPSGETLWSEQYNGDGRNIFGVQTDVAVRVARSLQASLAPEERARIQRAPTENTEAYELYLKARPLSLLVAKQNGDGIELLKRAVALDPKFALGYSALARRYNFLGSITGRDNYLLGLEAARIAVALDPQLARAHYALAIALGTVGQWDDSRLAMQRAIELDSNFSTAMVDFSVIETNAGRLDQALYWAKRAVPLAPNVGNSYYHLGLPLLLLDDQAAERWLRSAAARFRPNEPSGGQRLQILLSILDMRHGRSDAALERMRAAVAAQPDNIEGQIVTMELALFGGAPDAGDRIEKALAGGPGARSWWTPYTPRTMRAFLWTRSGDPECARPLIDAAITANRKAVDEGDRSFGPLYENAALYLMRADRAAALDWLRRAAEAGWRDAATLERDPLLAPLAQEPRFIEIVERITRDVQDMRKRVDLSDLEQWMQPVGGSPP